MAIKNLVPRTPIVIKTRKIVFTDEDGAGFCFDCDEKGNPKFPCRAAQHNYAYAKSHPELFPVEFDELVVEKRVYVEPAHGTCSCGAHVVLEDQYQGACSCPGCGQWYNLYGQELIPPEYWED